MLRFLLTVLLAAGTNAPVAAQGARILVIGDSVMAWNGAGAIPYVMAEVLGEPVRDESVSGARLSHPFHYFVGPMDIRRQSPGAGFDWVVLTGGANDFAAECDCGDCGAVLDALITEDSILGEIPDFLEEITAGGSNVLWAQYYEDPEVGGPFGACADEFASLNARLGRLAARMPKVHLADLGEAIDSRDAGHYDADRVHPSPEGSRRAGEFIAETLLALDR